MHIIMLKTQISLLEYCQDRVLSREWEERLEKMYETITISLNVHF